MHGSYVNASNTVDIFMVAICIIHWNWQVEMNSSIIKQIGTVSAKMPNIVSEHYSKTLTEKNE